MKNLIIISIIIGLHAQADESLVRLSGPLSPEEELVALHVPEGFEIHLFAAEPQINKPINLAYDSRGRVWVSSTVEYPYAAAKDRWLDSQGSKVRDSRDAIKILEDTDGDCRADKVVDFADGLNIPTGVLPWHKPEHQDGCIAWSIPNIWYFADTTGDGKADLREVLFGPLGYEKDTHGMCSSFRMGPGDGWVYATHGFNNSSTLTAKDGTKIELHSGNVFRFRPDGSSVEVYTRGQVNPFGLSFDGRENLYSADCHSAPVYQLLQGGVYPSFGKPHDGLGFAPTMIEHTHGSTGICGIVYLDKNWWGAGVHDHLLIGNPVTSRINHDRVEFRGTTPVAVEQRDFVTSDDLWFRPIDLCKGDGGSLYVADFYNRIIGHYEVPLTHPGRDRERGRIWKITRTGNITLKSPPPDSKEFGDPIAGLANQDPFERRKAAHTLQLQPKKEALDPLLDALAITQKNDTHLRHVIRMAIRNHLVEFPKSLLARTSHVEALLAFAPAVGTSEAASLLAKSTSKRNHLSHIARFADDETLSILIGELEGASSPKTQLVELDALQAGLDERGKLDPHPGMIHWAQALAVRLLKDRQKKSVTSWTNLPHPSRPDSPSPWVAQKRKCQDGQEVSVISSLPAGLAGAEERTGILMSKEFVTGNALSFWIMGHRGFPDQDPHLKSHVSLVNSEGQEVQRVYPPRDDIAQKVVWKTVAGKKMRLKVTDGDAGEAFAWLGITRISGVEGISIETFSDNNDLDTQLAKLAVLLKLHAPVSLRDQLNPWLPKSVSPIVTEAPNRDRVDKIIKERILQYETTKNKGRLDSKKGALVFQNHCASCHQIKRKGGLVGPQLDGIGSRGVLRLAEDILDPNRNVDSHFHLTNFTFKNGSESSAFITGERGKALQVRNLLGDSLRLQKSQIESRETVSISLMPPNFDKIISPKDFANLLEWLRTQS